MSYQELHEKIVAFSNKDCGKGATLQEINHAEVCLGVIFPDSYKQFLRDFGWIRFAHQELYGLGADVPTNLDLVRNTECERQQMHPLLLPSLIPVMNDGAGNHFCLDTQQILDSENPVVFWDHELGENQEPERVSDNFACWLTEMFRHL